MGIVTEMLTMLGANLPLVAVGCAEVLAAAALLGRAAVMRTQMGKTRASLAPVGMNRDIQRVLTLESGEVMLVLRRENMMLLACTGDPEKLLGVSYTALRDNIANLNAAFSDKSRCYAVWKKYMAWDGREMFDEAVQSGDGRWMRFIVRRTPDGEYDLLCFRDITALHDRIEECEKRLAGAEEESRAKTTFLSRMSHEIRTPMNGIIGMISLAKSRLRPGDEAMQYLNKADEVSAHLLALINDILDMSRIEAGKVELEHKVFSLRGLGDRLYDMFAKQLQARGIRYEVNLEDMTVDSVVGDELRISQIIINFLSNAVKFTSEGEIIVTFRQMMLQDNVADFMFRVHDTGIGMDHAFLNRIFRPFEQESIETGRKFGGTGLGMTITDQLVRLMGGEIVVDSAPGKGSDFTVFLHLPVAEQAAERAEAPDETVKQCCDDAFKGCRILMAEDNEINAEIAIEILGEMGAQVEGVENGRLAVEAFENHPENWYDLILMDVQMPEMDGRTAARTIRASDRADAKTIPIFALSADAFVEDERLSIQSGMNGHFAKPVDFTMLQQAIGVYLAKRKERSKKHGAEGALYRDGREDIRHSEHGKNHRRSCGRIGSHCRRGGRSPCFYERPGFYAGRRGTRDTHQSGAL